MKREQQQSFAALPRTSSSKKIIPVTYPRSTSINHSYSSTDTSLVPKTGLISSSPTHTKTGLFSSLLRSLLSVISFPTILRPIQLSITSSLGRKVTGTLFGNRRGHVSFAVQDDPKSAPVFLIELAISTSALVKEMSSGLVRIALECEKARGGVLFEEPMWTMYCNGRKCGYALSRACTDSDWHVLSTVQSVSIGAGVIPVVDDGSMKASATEGELLYMRAKFERVVGSRNSQAFYMLNPDGNGGPELSIFLLRL